MQRASGLNGECPEPQLEYLYLMPSFVVYGLKRVHPWRPDDEPRMRPPNPGETRTPKAITR
ncbi:GM10483 [Drosophila sechellia]|uniref:GM10483 n=1 Tax=Drosophila sechellia TaxID=7238 RepID=B4I4U1_DROSE|nr:GM10483 [Drosophila sechellia]